MSEQRLMEVFPSLKSAHRTKIVSADGHDLILFTNGPLEQEEIEVFQLLTKAEINSILEKTLKMMPYNLIGGSHEITEP